MVKRKILSLKDAMNDHITDRIDAATEDSGLTVGDLKRQLETWPDDMIIHMSGLTFYQFKKRGENLLQMEFDQLVYTDQFGIVRITHELPDPADRKIARSE